MDGADVFYDYLSRRLEHHKTRLEKVSKYQAMEPAELNQDQRNALAEVVKSEGKREEAEFLKGKYESQRDKRAEQLDKQLAAAREQGRLEAQDDLVNTLELISSFLSSMSEQYKAGNTQNMQDSREAYAFYQLLAQFYAGGSQGAAAMQRFVDGDSSAVCDNGVRFADLKESFANPRWLVSDPPPQPMQAPHDAETATREPRSPEAAPATNAAVNGSAKYGKAWKMQAKPWGNGKSWKKPKDETETRYEPRYEPRHEPKPEPKSEPKPELKPELKPEPKLEPKPELRADQPKDARPKLDSKLRELKLDSADPEDKRAELKHAKYKLQFRPEKPEFSPEIKTEGKGEDEKKVDRKSPSRKTSPGTEPDDFQVVGGAKERKPFRKPYPKKRQNRPVKSE